MTAGMTGIRSTRTAKTTNMVYLLVNAFFLMNRIAGFLRHGRSNLSLLFCGIDRERLEAHPAAGEELAEEFVVMETHGLDANNQGFNYHEKCITDEDRHPEAHVGLFPSNLEECHAETSVCHC